MSSTSLSSLDFRNPQSTTRRGLAKVPMIIAFFWLTKAATTAFGETGSDALNGLPTGPIEDVDLEGDPDSGDGGLSRGRALGLDLG